MLNIINICYAFLTAIKENEGICHYSKVSEELNLLEEILRDDVEHLRISKDIDAKIGHKTAYSFFLDIKHT